MNFRGSRAKSSTAAFVTIGSAGGDAGKATPRSINAYQTSVLDSWPTLGCERPVYEPEVELAKVDDWNRILFGRVTFAFAHESAQRVTTKRLVVTADAAKKPTVRGGHDPSMHLRNGDSGKADPSHVNLPELDVQAAFVSGPAQSIEFFCVKGPCSAGWNMNVSSSRRAPTT